MRNLKEETLFYMNVQRALLLALVNKELLTKEQFEQCMEHLIQKGKRE